MHAENLLITRCIHLLEQAAHLLARVDDNIYSKTSALARHGGIGGHLRHCLDFYQSFLQGLDDGRIDYNSRKRDRRVEQDRVFAIDQIHRCCEALRDISSTFRIAPIFVSIEEGDEGKPSWCGSSLVRELEFLQSHTIHHFSLIAILLRLEGIEPGEEFGVAQSTLRFWQQEALCAR